MCATINNTASCEVLAVIRFLLAINNNAAKIQRQLCEVYGPNVMSDSNVKQWCHLFEEGRTNVYDEEHNGRPSVITDDLVEKVNTTLCGNGRFTISELSLELPQVSRSVIYNIVPEKLGYKKLWARWVPESGRTPFCTIYFNGGSLSTSGNVLSAILRFVFRVAMAIHQSEE
jgi:hypothetical protein